MMDKINAPERLLFACANPSPESGSLDALIGQEIDWDIFREAAADHRMLPLVYKHFSSGRLSTLPSSIAEMARQAYTANAVRMEFLAAKLQSTEAALRNADIRFVSWKGPDLAGRAYKDLALRPADDLDFLIHPDDMPAAISLLSKLGFLPKHRMTGSARSYYLNAGYEFIMLSPAGDFYVELATHPIPPPSPLNRTPLTVWQNKDNRMTAELYFLYLCMHGAHHCWDRLIWVADLCAFVSAHELDWKKIVTIARQTRTETMLLSAVDLMDCLGCKVKLPEVRARRLPVIKLIDHALHSDGISALTEAARIANMHTRNTDRALYMFRWLFAPTFSDWQAVALPRKAAWLYWVLRPFRLVLSRIA